MTKRNREVVDRIASVLAEVERLSPSNPADTAAIFRNMRVATEAARQLHFAIISLRFDDYDSAADHLADAEATVGRKLATA